MSRIITSLKLFLLTIFFAGALLPSVLPKTVYAQTTSPPSQPEQPLIFKKSDCKGTNIRANLPKDNPNHCGILDYLVIFINVLSALVGVVIVIMIIVGGIQYSASGDDPQAVAAAKQRILNAVLALVVFIFTYAFLNWVVPGGIF